MRKYYLLFIIFSIIFLQCTHKQFINPKNSENDFYQIIELHKNKEAKIEFTTGYVCNGKMTKLTPDSLFWYDEIINKMRSAANNKIARITFDKDNYIFLQFAGGCLGGSLGYVIGKSLSHGDSKAMDGVMGFYIGSILGEEVGSELSSKRKTYVFVSSQD